MTPLQKTIFWLLGAGMTYLTLTDRRSPAPHWKVTL